MYNCPICDGSEVTKYRYGNHLGKINGALIKHAIALTLYPAFGLFHHRFRDWVSMRTLFSPFSHLLRCDSCGYAAYDKHIDPRMLERYYDSVYWQAGGLPPGDWHEQGLYLEDARANGQYRCVYEWVRDRPRLDVLEIGAGSALFSRLLREKHHAEVRLSVVEPGEGWESYYESVGIRLIAEHFPFESNQKFDYIHTSHWLEHVDDLDGALGGIRRMLARNGLLFVEVPNCNDEYYSLDISDAPHIHFFTRKSLRIAVEKSGFRSLTVDEYGLTPGEESRKKVDPGILDSDILREGGMSIRENTPRKGGSCLRGLFDLSE